MNRTRRANSKQRNSTFRRTGGGKLPKHAATMYELNKWHKRLFEELGWMILAKAKGYNEKIVQYKKGFNHFLKAVDHISSEYENQNRKHDLSVLRMNIEELKRFVMKHL